MLISDFKSSPFDIFNGGNNGNPNFAGTPTPVANGYRGTGLNGVPDTSLETLLGSKWSTASGQTMTLISVSDSRDREPGRLMSAPTENTDFLDLAITVPVTAPATEGTFLISVTNGGSSVMNQNFFAGGQLVVSSGTGIGQTLQIASHEAAATSGDFLVTLTDPIQTTLDVTSTVSFIANPAKDTHYSVSGSVPVGVTVYAIPASVAPTYDGTSGALTAPGIPQYAFVVSHGPVGALIDSTVTNVGYPLGPSAGSYGHMGVATLTTSPQIAISMQTQTSGEAGAVYMML